MKGLTMLGIIAIALALWFAVSFPVAVAWGMFVREGARRA